MQRQREIYDWLYDILPIVTKRQPLAMDRSILTWAIEDQDVEPRSMLAGRVSRCISSADPSKPVWRINNGRFAPEASTRWK